MFECVSCFCWIFILYLLKYQKVQEYQKARLVCETLCLQLLSCNVIGWRSKVTRSTSWCHLLAHKNKYTKYKMCTNNTKLLASHSQTKRPDKYMNRTKQYIPPPSLEHKNVLLERTWCWLILFIFSLFEELLGLWLQTCPQPAPVISRWKYKAEQPTV